MAGVGPMQGQALHFRVFAPEKIDYAINRYTNETRRLYSVLENRLKENGKWLVGDKCTIADLAIFPWVNLAFINEIDMKEFPLLEDWLNRISEREAVKKGLTVPQSVNFKKLYDDNKEATLEKAKEMGSWILRNQEEDAKKKYN